jgi:hypothetical protein
VLQQAADRAGGLVTGDDAHAYAVIEREPSTVRYRDAELATNPRRRSAEPGARRARELCRYACARRLRSAVVRLAERWCGCPSDTSSGRRP